MPPSTTNHQGAPRRVGYELEFAALDAGAAADVVQGCFGGQVTPRGPHSAAVSGTELGDFRVELDVSLLTDGKIAGWFEPETARQLEALVGHVSSMLAPYEIVTPPLPLREMPRLEELRLALRAAGAVGTGHAALYAFGVHINAELPSADAATLLAYVRAYAVLQEWLHLTSETDLARRLARFAKPWPEAWIERVLDPDYSPAIPELTADYLREVGDRNRALDLLPLLAWLDEDETFAALHEDPAIKPRPAFHYRLPNCRIADPRWTLAEEWNRWNEVERLAADRTALRRVVEGAWPGESGSTRRR